jgi:ferredoxin
MAMRIDADACVDCGACAEPCPNQAILKGGESYTLGGTSCSALSDKYFVVPDLCTQCVGYYDEPQCIGACPVDCIAVDPERAESADQLQSKFVQLKEKGVRR